MASNYWQTVLEDVEPTRFPDLTGRSPASRTGLSSHYVIENSISFDSGSRSTWSASASIWLAALFKIAALYSGENDLIVDYLRFQQHCDEDASKAAVRPIRIEVDSKSSNLDVLRCLTRRLEESLQLDPPQASIIESALDCTGISLSDILLLFRDSPDSNLVLIPKLYEQYSVIVEVSSFDAQPFVSVKMHVRSSIILSHDTPQLFTAFREAVHLTQTRPSDVFLSWSRCSTEINKSISNPNCKPFSSSCEGLAHSMFERHTIQKPSDLALDFLHEDQTRTRWSYLTLDSIANRIADALLQTYHIQLEDPIPICVSKSPAFYACILGVLKAGGSYTPFAGSPEERKKFMLGELEPKVVLHTSEENMSWCEGAQLFDVSALIKKHSTSSQRYSLDRAPMLSPSNLCYQMYTSGSTGRPKAVSLEHMNVVQTAYAARELVPWESQSRILQQAGVTFDMCYFETFFAWNTGICLCSAPNSLIYNSLTEVINTMEITLLGTTPSVALTIDPVLVPNVKWLYCIGEVLPQPLVDAWEGRLVNSYGPTEAAQMVTLFPVNGKVKAAVIGKPFSNTSFMVLQKESIDITPVLGIGELCIGGFQVARGYFKNKERTQQSFITIGDQRLYRTGDLVRMLSSGYFEFIGRVDDQVKVRGQRVELGEVDKALETSHFAIKRASTQILKIHKHSRSQLVAFLALCKSEGGHSQRGIRDAVDTHLSQTLPTYMIPTIILFVPRIPLSAAGKVDKRALQRMFQESEQTASSHRDAILSPSTRIQQTLQETFSAVARLPQNTISVETSIYQLGLDSISAIQIARILNNKGFVVQASTIMKYSSIVKLAPVLESDMLSSINKDKDSQPRFDYDTFDQQHRSTLITQLDISDNEVERIRPASHLQSSMIAQSTYSTGVLYFNHLTYHLPKGFDFGRFYEAWTIVVAKHEILRSGFIHLDDAKYPVAMITYRAGTVPIPVQLMEDTGDADGWGLSFAAKATAEIHLPPWRALVSTTQNKFFLSAHHSLYDAQVLDILLHDLGTAYDNEKLLPHRSFDCHLAMLLSEANLDEDSRSRFWIDHGNKAVASRFPNLHPLNDITDNARSVSRKSDLSLTLLEQGCRNAGVTLQAAAQLTWAYLLGALTGEDIVTFGTVLSGRTTQDSSEISFPMITTVPTVVDIRSTLVDSLKGLMDFNADVQLHQFTPLKKIQRWMGFAGETLFDTIFTYQKRVNDHSTANTHFTFHQNALIIDYPVSVELEPIDDHLQFSIYYKSNYMQVEQAELIVQQYQFLLENVIRGRQQSLNSIASDTEKRLFSIQPAEHEELVSQHTLLHHTVEMRAQKDPNKIAMEFVTSLEDHGTQTLTWTFRQLDEEGNKIANLLRKHHVAQGSIIVICFDKCPEAAFAMLGILKAGCAFLALDANAPMDRKRFIVEDSEAAILLSHGSMAESFGGVLKIPVIDLNSENMANHSSKPVTLDHSIDPQDTSYCLYTSGTTGAPKGCILTHNNAIQVLLCFERLYRYSTTSRWLQFASYHFDVSVMEHFWSWFVGITVVKASRDLILRDLSGTISRLKITHIDLTPSLARLLDPNDVPTLASGVFVTGGEMLRTDIIEKWGDSGAIHNAYGPTEATIGVTMYRHVPKNGRASNIGWPFPVVGVLVVNPADPTKPVLRGGIGELCVSGRLVAKGYLRRDQLTKQRFINLRSHRCYRTGDLVRLLSNGSIEFIGRTDDQVKLRGQRLEIGEINAVIRRSHDMIDDVSTLVLKHSTQQKEQLVSFVVVGGSTSKKKDLALCQAKSHADLLIGLRTACTEKLPVYMVPTHILPVNRIPLSPNNKVDGKQLKSLYEKADMSSLQNLISHNPLSDLKPARAKDEKKIWQVLSRVLGQDGPEILRNTTFFELGLDSVSLINFANSLKAVGYTEATPSLVMKNTTVSLLASVISAKPTKVPDGSIKAALQKVLAYQHRHKAAVATSLGLAPEAIEAVAPCTPLQAGIISRSLESRQGLYFASFTFVLNDSVDIQHLRVACQRACNRIEMLRTIFHPTDDGYMQIVLRHCELPWSEVQISDEALISGTLEAAHTKWQDRNGDTFWCPFEIVMTQTPTTTLLTVHIFHALYDGNSLALLLEAVSHEYASDLEPDYGSSFIEALPFGPLRERHGAKTFWQEHLSTLSVIHQPKFTSFVSNGAPNDTSISHQIGTIQGFEELRRGLNVTSQAIMQACWITMLQDVLHRPLAVGVVTSGRSIELADADKIIGPLFNTVPMLLTLHSQDTWRNVVLRCHDFNSSVLEYQHTSLSDIQKWIRKDTFRKSIFETLFTFQKERQVDERQSLLWQLRDETFAADYPLSIEIEQRLDNSFHVTLTCQAHISNEEFSQRMLDKFESTLRTVVENVDQPLSNTIMLEDLVVDHDESLGEPIEKVNGTNGWHHLNGNGVQNKSGVPPWSENMDRVRNTIAALAKVDAVEITPETSIFEVGLDSIDAVKLSSRLQKVTNTRLPVSRIMKLLTLNKIAAAIDEHGKDSEASETNSSNLKKISESLATSLRRSGINTESAEKILPCTPLQESMVADMINSRFQRYLNFDVLRLSDSVDIEKLKAAWRITIEKVPVLRSRFVQVENATIDCTFAQVVMPAEDVVWGHTETNKDFATITQQLRNGIESNFNEKPALRLSMVQKPGSTKPTHMVLALPHATYDGVSLGYIHDLVSEAYNGRCKDLMPIEPALLKILDGAGESSRHYWQQQLSDITPTFLPAKSTGAASRRSQRVAKTSLPQIQHFCKQHGVTVSSLSQTAWSIVLAYYAQRLDVCFAQVLSGRMDDSTENVIFPTMNTVISRAIIHGTRSEMVQFVQQSVISSSEHQHFPLRKALSLASNKGSANLINTLFIFQNSTMQGPSSKAKLYESVDSVSDVEYPVCVEAEVLAQQLIWRTLCKESHFDQSETELLLEQLDRTLDEIVQSPNEPVAQYVGQKVKLCSLEQFEERATRPAVSEDDSVQHDLPEDYSATEEAIRSVIAEVARLNRVDVQKNSNVFGLGLDSISVIKVSSMLRKQGIRLTVNEILDAGSFQKIAEAAENALSDSKDAINAATDLRPPNGQYELPGNLPIDSDLDQLLGDSGLDLSNVYQVLPASPGQIFLLSRWQNENVYYSTLDFWIDGCEDIHAIRSAWSSLVAQTPILRTIFAATGRSDHPIFQVILNHAKVQFVEVSSTYRLDDEVNSAHAKYDGVLSPPCALFVQRTKDDQFHLAFKMSHALYDGFSLAMLTNRLRNLLRNPDSPSIFSPYSFPEYLSRTFSSPTRRTFWTNYFAGINTPPPPAATRHNTRADTKTLHIVTTNTFKNLPSLHSTLRAKQLSIQPLLLAAYAITHARLHQPPDTDPTILGIYLANRTSSAADEIPAPTLGFVPLRIPHPLTRNIFDIARSIQSDMRAIALEGHGQVGLWELDEWTGTQIRPDVWVNILSAPGSRTDNPGTGVQLVSGERSEDVEEEWAVERSDESVAHGLLVGKNPVRRVHDYPMMDFEITVGEDALDVGILAPASMCDVDGARGMIRDFEAELDKVLEMP